MKNLKYILFILILLFVPDVFAQEVNVTNNCYGSSGYSNMYNGREIQYQTFNPYNFGTTYQYQLSSFETELRYNLSANTDYILTINTNNTDDFRNNFSTYNVYDLDNNSNNLVRSFTFISMKKVQIAFKTTTATSRVQIQMGGSNVYDNITGINNWNIKSVVLTVPDNAPSGSTNQDIIDNQTNNTNNIINNNNQNTSDIINNNNNNTQDIINQLSKDCSNLVDVSNFTLTKNNTDYFNNIDFGSNRFSSNEYTISVSNYNDLDLIFQIYTTGFGRLITQCSGKTGCTFSTNESWGAISIFLPSSVFTGFSTTISKVMLVTGTIPKTYCEYGSKVSNFDETTNAINQQNQYLMDNSNPNISDNDFLDMFNSVGINDPLSYLLTLPTQLINKIVSLSDTCSTINLGTLYGVMITLPCINLENILGSSIWNIIDVIFSVSLLVVIFKNLYDTFSNLLTMGAEKEAKEKFSMPTPMDFLSMILGGDR